MEPAHVGCYSVTPGRNFSRAFQDCCARRSFLCAINKHAVDVIQVCREFGAFFRASAK